jgi:hypothetical protein
VGFSLLVFEVFDHTQQRATVGRTPLDEWSIRRRDLYLTTHNTHNRQTSMPPVGFELTISTDERPKIYALDRAATGTGTETPLSNTNINSCVWLHLSILVFRVSYQTTDQVQKSNDLSVYIRTVFYPWIWRKFFRQSAVTGKLSGVETPRRLYEVFKNIIPLEAEMIALGGARTPAWNLPVPNVQ